MQNANIVKYSQLFESGIKAICVRVLKVIDSEKGCECRPSSVFVS